jgi:cytochrome c-type biogenesis protein CcmF
MNVGSYVVRYDQPRMEVDSAKRMVFADVTILASDGREIAKVSPAKFIYKSHPQMPTTEVGIESRPLEDLYVIMSTVDPETKIATLRVIVRPLVPWIWIGGLMLIFGTLVAGSPGIQEILADSRERPSRPLIGGRRAVAAASATLLLVLASLLVAQTAFGQESGSSSLHAGTVIMRNAEERQTFDRLLCMCGDCERLPLSSCGCAWAEDMRAELRAQMARGDDLATIQEDYRKRFGPKALAVPADEGLDRALWAVPVAGIVTAAGVVVWIGRRWRRRSDTATPASADGSAVTADDYGARLEQELAELEEG